MRDTPLTRLVQSGQSVWLDSVSRGMLVSGELISLIQEDGVSGVISSPGGYDREIGAGGYDDAIAKLARQGASAARIYETLVTEDARLTADLLHPLFERRDGRDGFVSVDISPHLAHDGAGMLLEARRLWELVDRPNLLVKVTGTGEGVAAVRQLVREGINVQVDLVFAVPRYRAVAGAYLDGLSERAARGLPLARVASFATLPVSAVDLAVEPLLSRIALREGAKGRTAALKGMVGISLARVFRSVCREIHSDGRYLALAGHGARPQLLLFRETSARERGYSDLTCPEALVGPGTVISMQQETLASYRDHGTPGVALDEGARGAVEVLERLHELGVDLNRLADRLEDEGVAKLARPYDSLLRNIELKRRAAVG